MNDITKNLTMVAAALEPTGKAPTKRKPAAVKAPAAKPAAEKATAKPATSSAPKGHAGHTWLDLMTAKDMSQTSTATTMGVAPMTLNRLINGHGIPTPRCCSPALCRRTCRWCGVRLPRPNWPLADVKVPANK